MRTQWSGAIWLSAAATNAIAVPLVFLGTRSAALLDPRAYAGTNVAVDPAKG